MGNASETKAKRDIVIDLLAKALAGLQVPMSIGGQQMLGAAYRPLVDLRGELRLFGYPDAEEHEVALRKVLG